MKKTSLALLVGTVLLSQSTFASDQNRAISYMTSWGIFDGDVAKIEKSKIDRFLLSFAKWNADGSIETSDDIATIPKYDPYWMPTAYITWTQLKHSQPEKKMMLAFGGQSYESIWGHIDTPEKREVVAEGLANLVNKPFPVYKKNMKELTSSCLDWNWNNTACNMANYQQAGVVFLDGIDFDFEKAARLTETENDNLLKLSQRVRELIGNDKLLSLTTYHVGADPVTCSDNTVFENCSYTQFKRSEHNGEVLKLLSEGRDVFDFFNVMAYDAGRDFKYKTAMANYAKAVGDASKIILGTTINSQWDPVNNFVETKENNIERARWQKEEGYGGFFTWAIGANTDPKMGVSEQVAYINEMKSAADDAEVGASNIKLKAQAGLITIVIPESAYKAQGRVMVRNNGEYIAEVHEGTSYYSTSKKTPDGATVVSVAHAVKAGDNITVALHGGTPGIPGTSSNLIKPLSELKVTADMLVVPNVFITKVTTANNKVSVTMPTSVFESGNRIIVSVNGNYVAESYEGVNYYSYKEPAAEGQTMFSRNVNLKKGDVITVDLVGGMPGADTSNVLKNIFKGNTL